MKKLYFISLALLQLALKPASAGENTPGDSSEKYLALLEYRLTGDNVLSDGGMVLQNKSVLKECPPDSEETRMTAIPGPGGKVSVSLNGPENQIIFISVYNIIGNRVFSIKYLKNSPDSVTIRLDRQFEPGLYFITGVSGNKPLKQQKVMLN